MRVQLGGYLGVVKFEGLTVWSTQQLNAYLQARLNPLGRGRLETRNGDVVIHRRRRDRPEATTRHEGPRR